LEGTVTPVIDDHSPFLEGIPAVDLIDFDTAPPDAGCVLAPARQPAHGARSLGVVGGPALAALPAIR
jgi:hypothetical protein